MEYLIWYNAATRCCYIGLKGQYELLVNTFTDQDMMIVEERKIKNHQEYRKALKMLVRLRKTLRYFSKVL